MLFHTWIFLVFFLVVYSGFLLVRKTRFKALWLLLASYVFYGWWNPLYLLLILWSTTVDYLAVLGMSKSERRRKLWLLLSILNNLGLLGFFKYSAFLAHNINALVEKTTGHAALIPTGPIDSIVLPVGISFFVFQSMSYTIDYYRGHVRKEPNFIRYAAFVALFPQLVAGPIERARNLLPQIRRASHITRLDVTDGLSLFVVGLFKKIALADYLALYVDRVYASPGDYQSPALLLATFAFAWQIYFDFSGYTDMARGIGRLMGLRLMLNFNNPYVAVGLGDFWGRWHISLSTWFRDYVYIPLGGNRRGTLAMYRNIFITMLVSGFWHGAAWTMIVWGALHAIGVAITRELERSALYRERVPKIVKQLAVFLFVCFAWIFFRAATMEDALLIIRRICASGYADPRFPLLALLLILSIWLYQFLYDSSLRKYLAAPPVRIALVLAMILYMVLFSSSGDQPFIYFQF